MQELEEMLVDIETVLNNRALIYIEEDIQMPNLILNNVALGTYNDSRRTAG